MTVSFMRSFHSGAVLHRRTSCKPSDHVQGCLQNQVLRLRWSVRHRHLLSAGVPKAQAQSEYTVTDLHPYM